MAERQCFTRSWESCFGRPFASTRRRTRRILCNLKEASDDIFKMGMERIAARVSIPEITVPPVPRIPNVAESAYQRPMKMIQSFFEVNLDRWARNRSRYESSRGVPL